MGLQKRALVCLNGGSCGANSENRLIEAEMVLQTKLLSTSPFAALSNNFFLETKPTLCARRFPFCNLPTHVSLLYSDLLKKVF